MYRQNKLIATNALTANKTYTKNGQYRKVTVKNLKKNLPVKTGPQNQLVSGKITEKDLSFVPATKESLTDLETKTKYQSVSGTDTVFSGDVKVQNDKVVATQEELQAVNIFYQSNIFPPEAKVTNVDMALDNLKAGGVTCLTDQDLYTYSDVKFNNLTLTDVTTGGMLKTATDSKIEFAIPDTDYATVSTLKTIASQAQQSAENSKNSANQANEYKENAFKSATNAGDSATNAGTSATNAGDSATNAATSAEITFKSIEETKTNADVASQSADVASLSANRAYENATKTANVLNNIKNTTLNSLPNSDDVDFKGFKGINVADGVDDTDIATYGQIKNLVQSVTGTDGLIEVTTGTTPIITLAKTGVDPKNYESANITVDAYGRVTIASDGSTGGGITNINGTTNQIDAKTSLGTCTLSLLTTGVTPKTYTAANITVDSYGRVTAATSTTLVQSVTGTPGSIQVTPGTTTPVISLATTGVEAKSYTAASITVDAYGRVTKATSTNPVQSPYLMTFAGNNNFIITQYLAANAFPTTNIENLNVNSEESNIIAPFNGSISTIYVSRTLNKPASIYIYKNKILLDFFVAKNQYQILNVSPEKNSFLANDTIAIGILCSENFASGNCLITLLFKSA
jgi:hypothetical protein